MIGAVIQLAEVRVCNKKSRHRKARQQLKRVVQQYDEHRKILLTAGLNEDEISNTLNSLSVLCNLLQVRIENLAKQDKGSRRQD